MNVLVIEDNADLAANIVDFLVGKGHSVDYAATGKSGLELVQTTSVDVVILDLMLPDIDGLEVCQRLREAIISQPFVLMLTARDTLDDKLAGFGVGADDYLVKPFSLREVAARLEALGQRAQRKQAPIIQVGSLELDLHTQQVWHNEQPIVLAPTALKLLKILMRASPGVVSKADLEREIWGDNPPDSEALRSHIYELRRKIDRPFSTSLLKTIPKLGYKIISEKADYRW